MDEYGTTETNNSGNATSVLPVYTDITTNGTPQNICVTDQFDRNITAFNTLGARRYMRFTIPGSGSYRFTASFASQNIGDVLDPPDPADPDIALHQSGLFAISEAVGTTETYCRNMNAGDYILEIYDYSLFTPHSNTSTRCFNVSILPVTNC